VPSTKNLAARQKASLFVVLASLNNGHNFDLCACCVGVKSSSRPKLVLARPLCLHSATWRSSLVVNLSSIAPRRVPVIEVEARAVANRCRMAAMTLVCSLIWPCNNFVLSRCTSSFLVLPSLASKPVRRRLSLHSSYLSASTNVSTARLTTWRTFLAIIVVHLGSSVDVALVVIAVVALCSIS